MKILKEKYKTWEGARKRAAFENGVAKSEFRDGCKAKAYHYAIITELDDDGQRPVWRVRRDSQARAAELPLGPGHGER